MACAAFGSGFNRPMRLVELPLNLKSNLQCHDTDAYAASDTDSEGFSDPGDDSPLDLPDQGTAVADNKGLHRCGLGSAWACGTYLMAALICGRFLLDNNQILNPDGTYLYARLRQLWNSSLFHSRNEP